MVQRIFETAVPVRTFENVAQQIRRAIVEGKLQPGQRLPAQRELAVTFGVGRTTLLAALRMLEQQGLIVIRPGARGGAYVAAPDIEQVSESLDLLLRRDGVRPEELAEFRAQLEGRCASWAAMRASQDELEELRQRLESLSAIPIWADVSRWGEFLTHEVEMHIALSEAAHNRVALAVLRAIHTTTSRAVEHLPPVHRGRILSDWGAILEALAQRDAHAAEAMVSEHIRYFSQMEDG